MDDGEHTIQRAGPELTMLTKSTAAYGEHTAGVATSIALIYCLS